MFQSSHGQIQGNRMQREIKFRAVIKRDDFIKKQAARLGDIGDWDIIYFELNDLIRPSFSIRELLMPWLKAGNKPDQFTDIKDQNGKEIWEDDIVSHNDAIASPVFFDLGMFRTECNRLGNITNVALFHVSGSLKVIGNLHQHKIEDFK